MKNRVWAFAIPAVILLAVFLVPSLLTSQRAVMYKPSKEDVAHKMQRIQIPFVTNNGQVDAQVKFYANTFGGTVFVTKDGEIVYSLPNNSSDVETQCLASSMHSPGGISPLERGDKGVCNTTPISNGMNETHPRPLLLEGRSGVALKEQFVGAKVKTIQGDEKAVTKVNYFKGNDKSQWKTNISTYDVASLGEVYDGIELKLKAYGNNVEKLFCVKPGANPEQIKISLSGIQPSGNPPPLSPSARGTGGCPPLAGAGGGFVGARGLWVNEHGELVAETELGPVKFTKPVAYQEIDGKRVEVAVEYVIRDREPSSIQQTDTDNGHDSRSYCFTVASYDKSHNLIIDPLLASTFLGGSGSDIGYSLALDTSGNVYVTGYTESTNFPTTSGAYDTSGNYDVFVSKLNGGLTSLLASTYLGGAGNDYGFSLTLDTGGNVYVTGYTASPDFPTTSGAYDTVQNDNSYDVFVSKLNSGLTNLLASTYLGGSYRDSGYSLTLDNSGNVYVTGYTYSKDFPTMSGAYYTSYNGGDYDVFVSKLNSGLTSLLSSTYLGGSGGEIGYALTLDTSGNVYVTGYTYSKDFPTTSGVYDTSNGGGGDVFVSKLDGGLTSLLASTFLGGSIDDFSYSLALDTSGNVYVTGYTYSKDFPTTSGAYDTSQNGIENGTDNVFVSKLNSELTSLLASTYLGGGYGRSLSLDTSGNVYVTGETWSEDFPTTNGAYDTSLSGDYDVFVSKLNGGLTSLLASTYLGGSIDDFSYALALDTSGNVYVTGRTLSTDFPTTSGAYDTSFGGGTSEDAFVSKLDGNLSDTSGPTGFVSINNDDVYTNSTNITLTLMATDNGGVEGYYISTNSSAPSISDSGWVSITPTANYSENIPYSLSGGDGEKTLYVWYKDGAGNVSSVTSDSIILDTTAPTVTITSPTSNDRYSTTNSVIALGGSVSDSTSGVSVVTWENDKGGNGVAGGTTDWLTSSVSLLLGENVITVTAIDGVGNTGVDTITVKLTEGSQGSISGYVLDIGGNPIENAKVRLKRGNIAEKTVSDEDGFFEFEDLDAGTYAVIVRKMGYKISRKTVKLKDDEDIEIEIKMKKQ